MIEFDLKSRIIAFLHAEANGVLEALYPLASSVRSYQIFHCVHYGYDSVRKALHGVDAAALSDADCRGWCGDV